MKHPLPAFWMLLLLSGLFGCSTPTLQKSVAATIETAEAARDVYYEQVALGNVSAERQAEIDEAIRVYQDAAGAAIFIARNDLAALPPEELTLAVLRLVELVDTLTR